MSRELKDEILHFDGIKLWDRSCLRSVVNLLPPALGKRLEDCRAQRPELFAMDEDTLRAYFRKMERPITATENQLRLKFWCEYEFCISEEKPGIEISRAVAGICSIAMFYSYVTRPESMAWLLCVPLSYDAHLDELLNYGAARMRQILAMEPEGNAKLMKLQFDIYQAAENRKLGPMTQKSLHLHAAAPGGPRNVQTAIEGSGDSVQEKRIAQLRNNQKRIAAPSKMGRLPKDPPPPVVSDPIEFVEQDQPVEEELDSSEADESEILPIIDHINPDWIPDDV